MLKKIYYVFLISPFFLMADDHKAQGNSTDWEIKAYTTSAPNFIGDFATVIGASGEVLREGTNGWTCLPFIAMPKMGFKSENEAAPACADQNAMAWASAYLSQTEPKLENDGWIWMLHGDTGVDNFRPYSEGDLTRSVRALLFVFRCIRLPLPSSGSVASGL